ncbi:winged helix-turn-helix domain-containing protein [Acrocarpospora sp. B8E8]|uniref:winged helix-turn-helix domain-containing protein n=1 Tax=Acrocarpospora sp. B8E8 TaxID=3153572 RepID=UPI00325DE079
MTRRGQALWKTIAEELRARIANGTYRPDGPFPSETALVQEYGIARGTARKITAKLRDEGLIYTEPQVGSYVMPAIQELGESEQDV